MKEIRKPVKKIGKEIKKRKKASGTEVVQP
jgi:hypothetical protein